MEEMRPDIMTAGGTYFDLKRPWSSKIDICHIIHALSNLCRFTGHTRTFYSVAQHSVMVSYLVPREHALAGLLHDAAEAYIGDVSRPLKAMLPDYKAIEREIESAVFAHFGLPCELPEAVKQADMVMLATEKRDLMLAERDQWECIRGQVPLPTPIVPVGPTDARFMFWQRWNELKGVS